MHPGIKLTKHTHVQSWTTYRPPARSRLLEANSVKRRVLIMLLLSLKYWEDCTFCHQRPGRPLCCSYWQQSQTVPVESVPCGIPKGMLLSDLSQSRFWLFRIWNWIALPQAGRFAQWPLSTPSPTSRSHILISILRAGLAFSDYTHRNRPTRWLGQKELRCQPRNQSSVLDSNPYARAVLYKVKQYLLSPLLIVSDNFLSQDIFS